MPIAIMAGETVVPVTKLTWSLNVRMAASMGAGFQPSGVGTSNEPLSVYLGLLHEPDAIGDISTTHVPGELIRN